MSKWIVNTHARNSMATGARWAGTVFLFILCLALLSNGIDTVSASSTDLYEVSVTITSAIPNPVTIGNPTSVSVTSERARSAGYAYRRGGGENRAAIGLPDQPGRVRRRFVQFEFRRVRGHPAQSGLPRRHLISTRCVRGAEPGSDGPERRYPFIPARFRNSGGERVVPAAPGAHAQRARLSGSI